MEIRQAVVFAGGKGLRLRPYTFHIPKPMIPINNKPFLEYLINELKRKGIQEIVLLVGHLKDSIMEYFGNGSGFGVDIKYSEGSVYWETGRRLKRAMGLLDDHFLLLYGDNYWNIELQSMVEFYEKMKQPVMLTAYKNEDGTGEYGNLNNVFMFKDGHVAAYDEPNNDRKFKHTNMGFFIVDYKIVQTMSDANISFEYAQFPKLIKNNQLVGYETDKQYYYLTTPNDIDVMRRYFEVMRRHG